MRGLTGALACLATAASGCFTTRAEGDLLRQQLAEIKVQLAERAAREHELDAKLRRLDDALDRATVVLERNTADLGLSVEKLKEQTAATEGRIDDLSHATDSLEKRFTDYRAASDSKLEQIGNTLEAVAGPPIPGTPDGVYAEAERRVAAAQWRDARRLFEAFANRYPNDPRAPKAWYEIGSAWASEKLWANAIRAWTNLIDQHPAPEIEADAMYQTALAFRALKYCGDARIYLQQLLRRHRDTKWKKDAEDQLRRIEVDRRNRAACTS